MNKNYPRLTEVQKNKLRNTDVSKVSGVTIAEDDLSQKYGPLGSPSRNEFDNKAQAWYYGEILRNGERL